MTDPIRLNVEYEKSPDAIAFQDKNGNWRAGGDAKGYQKGQFVDSTYAKKARGLRKYNNDLKRTIRSGRNDADTKEGARAIVNSYREMEQKFKSGEISQAEFNEFINETFAS